MIIGVIDLGEYDYRIFNIGLCACSLYVILTIDYRPIHNQHIVFITMMATCNFEHRSYIPFFYYITAF